MKTCKKEYESKHTLGKWEWSTGDPDKRNYGVYSVEGGRIAEVLNQNRANAQLIAAAPILLKALKDLQRAVREHKLLDIKKRFSLCNADVQANKAIIQAEN